MNKDTYKKFYDNSYINNKDTLPLKLDKDEILYEALYGSQNYGLDDEKADIDTKVITIPDIKRLLFMQPYSRTVEIPDGLADIKDIQIMEKQFFKANINYLEILSTGYCLINADYHEEMKALKDLLNEIVNNNLKSFTSAIIGMAINKQKEMLTQSQFKKTYANVQKYGYDGKNAAHILRLEECLERVLAGESLGNALNARVYRKYETIKALKNHELSKEEAVLETTVALENIRYQETFDRQDTPEKVRAKVNEIICDIVVKLNQKGKEKCKQ